MATIERKDTPKSYDSREDPKKKAEHDATSYYCRNYRCGAYHIVNSTEGNEYVEMGDRAGNAIKFVPEKLGGGIQTVAHRGMQDIVYGEYRSFSTGANDITARGDYSVRTNQNANITADGNMNTSVKENMSTTAKNMNTTVAEKMHTVAQEQSTIVKNSMHVAVTDGQMTFSASKGMAMGSKSESASIYGGKSATLEGKSKVALTAGSEMHVKVGGAEIYMDGTNVYINSGKAQEAKAVYASSPSAKTTPETPYKTSTQTA